MSRQRTTQTIQKAPLFTFLDVLTCTMGLLILLLVAIARQSKLKSIDQVESARSSAVATQAERDQLHEQLGNLQSSRDRRAQELAQRQAALRENKELVRRLREELAELERSAALLNQSLAAGGGLSDPDEIAKLEARISELRSRLQTAREKGSSPSYAIIPFLGPNETRRRPIYIECRRDRIVLQPEGVALTERDFDGPLDNSNALASVVRAAEQHLGRTSQTDLREAGEPYPLLLVRPDGINSYYVARAALRGWGADFGYELIDGDWKLDFQQPNAGLASVEAKALEDSRERQKFLGYAGAGIGGGGAFSGDSRGQRGDFEQSDEEPRSGRYRVAADGRVVREAGGYRSSRPRVGGSRLSKYAEITGEGAEGDAAHGSPKPGTGSGTGQAGSRSSVAEWNDPFVAPPGSGISNGLTGSRGTQSHAAKPGAGSDAQSSELTGSDAGDSGGKGGGGSATTAQAAGSAGAASAAGSAAGGGPSLIAPNGTGQPASNGGGSLMGSPADPTVASDQQGPQILPQKMFGQNHGRDGGSASSLADSQGKNWALPDSSRGSIPVTRPINVEIQDDRVVVLPEVPGGPGRRELAFAGPTSNAVTGLITAIWDRMDGWGIAGKGMYWRPELHVTTTPDGARRLAELKALLADSGVVIVERPSGRTAMRY